MRRIGVALAALAALALASAAVGLAWAHAEMRALDPPLPSLEALRAFADAGDLPLRVARIDTATQAMPRAQVLDPGRDPRPEAPYVMSHPAFVLEWADGRRLLVDAGMDRDGARAFGRPIEWMGGAPIESHGSLVEQTGAWLAAGPLGIVFTHLHTDHVGGVVALCALRGAHERVALFQTAAQAERANFTTRPGRALLDAAACLDRTPIEEAPAAAVPGFPGVFVLHAAGHTPGSQVIGAWLRASGGSAPRGLLFTGDVVNARDGILHDVPKPWAYRTFLVPENETRQQRVRSFLREAAERAGFTLVVSHDALALADSGIPEPSATGR